MGSPGTNCGLPQEEVLQLDQEGTPSGDPNIPKEVSLSLEIREMMFANANMSCGDDEDLLVDGSVVFGSEVVGETPQETDEM